MSTSLRALRTDIAALTVDAIVNAANSSLLAAVASTGRSIALPDRGCCRHVAFWVGVIPEMPN